MFTPMSEETEFCALFVNIYKRYFKMTYLTTLYIRIKYDLNTGLI